MAPSRSRTPLVLAALFFLGAYCYVDGLGNKFHFDDLPGILFNESLRGFDVARVWAYHPQRFVPNLTFAAQIALFGMAMPPFQIINVLCHIVAGLCVFGLAKSIVEGRSPSIENEKRAFVVAAVAAAIFLAHPLQSQAVSYYIQRQAELVALF